MGPTSGRIMLRGVIALAGRLSLSNALFSGVLGTPENSPGSAAAVNSRPTGRFSPVRTGSSRQSPIYERPLREQPRWRGEQTRFRKTSEQRWKSFEDIHWQINIPPRVTA
jgi:hypothetical protein